MSHFPVNHGENAMTSQITNLITYLITNLIINLFNLLKKYIK